MTEAPGGDITREELGLAGRNHSMPLEALRANRTPVGLHYTLIHFDIPFMDASSYRLEIGGAVERPISLDLEAIKARPPVSLDVTLECAGNGRTLMTPRPLSQPWVQEAVGTATWSGTPLKPLLEEAGIGRGGVDVVFTGADRGIQGEVEHDYERSLSVDEALRDEVILAYAMNGAPLPPQHGFPLRLVVPGWYGMAHVKWLRSITVIREAFRGFQQVERYRLRTSDDDPGVPVTRILPRSLMIPPGIPDYFSRTRHLQAGPCLLEGKAWSGRAPIAQVEVSTDGGRSWRAAQVGEALSPFAWAPWRYAWEAAPGEWELLVRATDRAGNTQPLRSEWNPEGTMNNQVQRVNVVVKPDIG
jgi:sulfane dehydrogenase subunit SoxC